MRLSENGGTKVRQKGSDRGVVYNANREKGKKISVEKPRKSQA